VEFTGQLHKTSHHQFKSHETASAELHLQKCQIKNFQSKTELIRI